MARLIAEMRAAFSLAGSFVVAFGLGWKPGAKGLLMHEERPVWCDVVPATRDLDRLDIRLTIIAAGYVAGAVAVDPDTDYPEVPEYALRRALRLLRSGAEFRRPRVGPGDALSALRLLLSEAPEGARV